MPTRLISVAGMPTAIQITRSGTHNHVFYTVSTHEFFYTIELRSNNLDPPSTSSLLLPSDNHKSQDHRSTDPYITRNNFFYIRKRGQNAETCRAQEQHGHQHKCDVARVLPAAKATMGWCHFSLTFSGRDWRLASSLVGDDWVKVQQC